VGRLECRAWETYYRRDWVAFLLASVRMVRAACRMSWPRTLPGARLVLRANQKWAPVPDNDPDAARALMRKFYVLLAASDSTAWFDPTRASELEVEWWRAHRAHQGGAESFDSLAGGLADLYAYTYGADRVAVLPAARLRAEAMDVSDAWVQRGCAPDDPELVRERALLVRSYAALLAAVHG
jgi:hypothetical protein